MSQRKPMESFVIAKNAASPIQFNRKKHQIFLFDSCSSYSYYLGMFDGKKDPGTLAVMTSGPKTE